MNKPVEGFFFDNAGQTLLFWRLVTRYKINTEAGRLALLRKLVARKKAKYVRDVRPVIKGKKAVFIRRPDNG